MKPDVMQFIDPFDPCGSLDIDHCLVFEEEKICSHLLGCEAILVDD
jgi:hypothetical protein